MSLPDWVPPQPTRGVVGQITHHLDHLAEMLYAIDEYDELDYHHHRRIAFVDRDHNASPDTNGGQLMAANGVVDGILRDA